MPARPPYGALALMIAAVVASLLLVWRVAVPDRAVPAPRPAAVPAAPPAPSPAGPRRLPVAGAPGYVLVLDPSDGAGYLEDPAGDRTPLEAAPARIRGLGRRLVVLDQGVVAVPEGAVVTYQGPDRLVTHDAGSATVYRATGAVEHLLVSGLADAGGPPPDRRPDPRPEKSVP